MTARGVLTHNLAGPGDLESLGHGFPRLAAGNWLRHKARKIGGFRLETTAFPAPLRKRAVRLLYRVSAAELIEQIKALPPAEVEVIRNFLLNGKAESGAPAARYASDAEFDQAARRVFEKHDELLRKLAQ